MNAPWLLFGTMAACGLLTFLIRFSFIAGGRRIALGTRFHTFLRYVPPAVLSALIAPEILIRNGALNADPANPRLWAAAAAAVTALATRSVLATIAAGMATLWLLQYLA